MNSDQDKRLYDGPRSIKKTDPAIGQRGVYLMADTPLTAHPLALEDGSGDKQLLAEAIGEQLDQDDLDTLIQSLIEESNRRSNDLDGTAIECKDCGHVRETTEKNPTLVNCDQCGSHNLRYADPNSDRSGREA